MGCFIEELNMDNDVDMLFLVLKALPHMLMCGMDGESGNAVVRDFQALGGLDRLIKLQMHKNEDVYQKAIELLQKYFEVEETPAASLRDGGQSSDVAGSW